MAVQFPDTFFEIQASDGAPIPGVVMSFYEVGTNTPKEVFADNALTVTNGTSIETDAAGRFPINYLADEDYKVLVDYPDGTTITIPAIEGRDIASDLPNVFTKTQTWGRGADVASAAALVLGDDGNYFDIVGTTDISSIGPLGVATWIKLHFNGALTLIHDPIGLILPGGVDISVSPGDEAGFVEYEPGNWRLTDYQESGQLYRLGRGHIDGFVLSNNATDAVNDIDIAPGEARSDLNDANLFLSTAVGKQIDATWAPGGTPGAAIGGMSSSLFSAGHPNDDTTYHVIAGLVSGNAEIGFDTSITGANLVTDHSFSNTRRLGSVRRLTAANELFFQDGDRFVKLVKSLVVTYGAGTIPTVETLLDAQTPVGVKNIALLRMAAAGSTASIGIRSVLLSSPDQTDSEPTTTLFTLELIQGANENASVNSYDEVRTNTSGEIRIRGGTVTGVSMDVLCDGWVDRRGKDAT